jgi:cytochrome c oxidase subunit 1
MRLAGKKANLIGLLERYITTTRHTDIGVMYITTAFVFFVMAGITAMLMRIETAFSGRTIVDEATYNSMFTVHGTTMIFLFMIPVLVGLANWVIPKHVGAPDMAFPRLNALSYWTYVPAGVLIWVGMPAIGWTGYAPLSVWDKGYGVDLWLIGLVLIGISSILSAVNFLATIVILRRPGVTFRNMSLFVWGVLVTVVLILLATPVLTSAFTMLLMDRHMGTSFFAFTRTGVGEPLLWEHLFWFYSHPAVYIMILPVMGAISVIIPRMSRRPIFSYWGIAMSSVAILALSFTVWAHHMFTTGLDLRVKAIFMYSSMVIAVPTGIKVFSWTATMWNGRVQLKAPTFFALGFISMFVIGGISGVFQASVPLDYMVRGTYWLVAHIHYVLFGGSVFGVFAAMYFWFPNMTGRYLDERLGAAHFALTFVGFNMTYFVMHWMGLMGLPRRVYDPPSQFLLGNQLSMVGAMILGVAQLIFIINVFYSIKRGAPAPAEPWE